MYDKVETCPAQSVGEAYPAGMLVIHSCTQVEEAEHQIREFLVAPDVRKSRLRVTRQSPTVIRCAVAVA